MDLHPGVPGDLGDRIGVFEQPGLVGPSPVVHHPVRIREKYQVAAALEVRTSVLDLGCAGAKGDRSRWSRGKDTAPLQRAMPEASEVLVATLSCQSLPAALKMGLVGGRAEAGQGSAHLLGGPEQHVPRRQRVEYRLHDRLHQIVHPSPGADIVPPLQGMVLWKDQITERGGLVEVHRGGDLVAYLLKARSEPAGLGQRVRRIGIMDQSNGYLATVHAREERVERSVSIGALIVSSEVDGLTQISGHE